MSTGDHGCNSIFPRKSKAVTIRCGTRNTGKLWREVAVNSGAPLSLAVKMQEEIHLHTQQLQIVPPAFLQLIVAVSSNECYSTNSASKALFQSFSANCMT